MWSFFRSSFWSFISIAARTVSALAINKLVALQFGPNGITLLAHFQNLIAIATTIPNDGINLGLVTYLSGKEPAEPPYRNYFWAVTLWQLVVFGGVTGIFLLRRDFFLGAFLEQVAITTWILCFLIGLFLLLICISLQALLLARQALVWYAGFVSLTSIGGAAFIWLLRERYSLPYLLLFYLVSQGIMALVALVLVYKKGWLPRQVKNLYQKEAFRDIGKFIVMGLTLAVCSKLVNFYVRDYVMERFGLYQAGLWQAVVKLSDNYTMVFTLLLGMVYYPKLAASMQQPEALRQYVRQIFYVLVPLTGAGLIIFYLGRRWFILLFFDEQFLAAAYLLDYQVLGDFFKMSAWVLSYIITAQARVGFNIIVQVTGAVFYLLLLFWFINQFGLAGVTMAHCASFGLFLVFNLIYFRKLIF